MLTVYTLASGSSGNALALLDESRCYLIDAGISCRRIRTALASFGVSLSDLSGIFITHTHGDHISGLRVLLKSTRCPFYSSGRTCRQLDYRLEGIRERLAELPLCAPVRLPDSPLWAVAFPTSHDAPGSCGFRFDSPGGAFGLLTDTGFVTDEARSVLPGVNLAVLEANHDVETLRSGPYPYYLKQRILGAEGHLSNEDAAAFAVELARSGTSELVLAHLSAENNTPAMARAAVARALDAAGCHVALSVAPRDTASRAYPVGGAAARYGTAPGSSEESA